MSFTAQNKDRPVILQHNNQHSADQRCGYPSKRCENRRVVKRDGGLHRFCEHHRLVANRNQQRLQQRRRVQKGMAPSAQQEDLAAMHQLYNDYTTQGHQTQMQMHGEGYAQTATDSILDLSEEDL